MTQVLFVLLPKVLLLDVVGPADAFRIANRMRPGSFELAYASPLRAIDAGCGLHIGRLRKLPARLGPDTLVVLAGVVGAVPDFESPAVRQLVVWLAEHRGRDPGRVICVCAGALLAARAGLLHDRECTTHHACIDALARLDPSAKVRDNRIFVEDGPVITSAGITAGIDVALHLIARECGPLVASAVAREMVVYLRRTANDPALSPWVEHRNHVHPGVHRVQDAIVADPAAPWSAERMAAVACTSARHLARLFAEHAGCSPLDYLHQVRHALAKEMLANSALGVERVAERAGFSSPHQMRRVWRKFEPAPPSAGR